MELPFSTFFGTPNMIILSYQKGNEGVIMITLEKFLVEKQLGEDLKKVAYKPSGYYTAKYNMPICNHSDGVTEENIGFAKGITAMGVPFEAELYQVGETMTLAVIMPQIFDSCDIEDERENLDSNVIGFNYEVESWDGSVLDFGMVDEGIEDAESIVQKYVDFLVDTEIISFASNIWNGMVMYRTDVLGNSLVKILITLSEAEEFWAYTDIPISPFETNLKRVKYKKVLEFAKRY